jgi:uncharacterized C2H2 Zn-finger protein
MMKMTKDEFAASIREKLGDELAKLLADDDTLFRCTKCGRIGSVGRCCGLDTREPLNDLARAELVAEEKRRANNEISRKQEAALMKCERCGRLQLHDEEAHLHQGEYVGPCCWDGLKSSE